MLALALVCTSTPSLASAAKKPKLNKTSVKLRVGKTVKLKLKNNKKKVKWSSANKKIATVNKSGLVKAKKKGKTRIIAKVKKKKYVCKLTVMAKNTSTSQPDGGGTASGGDPAQNPTGVPSVETPEPGNTMKPTVKPEDTEKPGATAKPGNTDEPGPTPKPEETPEPGTTPKPETTPEPGTTPKPETTPEPGTTPKPEETLEPGATPIPETTSEPGTTPEPGNTPEPGTTPEPENTPAPENPGQEVTLPSGATVFTMGGKKLAIGMSEADVNTVLGTEVRTGKAPQGFDTIAYNTPDYSEYLLIYLKDDVVAGICGIGKNMRFGDARAGENGNILNSNWRDISGYKTTSGKTGAKKSPGAGGEMAYAFYDALGDNSIYCIQVFDSTLVKDADNDMIYMTSNLSYDGTVNPSIATEIGHMLNAFRKYRNIDEFGLHAGLAKCAQDYCNSVTASKIDARNENDLDTALSACGIVPCAWGEGCYYDAADAISFANSLIELDDFYNTLLTDTDTYFYIGVGMAATGSHTYVAVDYVDEI